MEANKYITVSALNRYLAYKFENDPHLKIVYIKAEISNLRLSKGILYFVLKDNEAEISGLMFQTNHAKLKFKPVDGMTVLVTGKVGIYPKRGTYSITVYEMEEAGLGNAYLQFLQLKEKLDQEGLFKSEYKLPIPRMSENIGVITSDTGDALHDIISTIEKRFPIAKIYLYPALVQGPDAPQSLIKALNQANNDNIVDVIIIGRGGGSLEDLSCFNDENLARTIFASKIPTVSAVGHEADYTICDFVASLRAPTPTGAAVLVTRETSDIIREISNNTKQIINAYKHVLVNLFNSYQNIINRYEFKNFDKIIDSKINDVQVLINHLQLVSPMQIIEKNIAKVEDLSLRLKLINLTKRIYDYQKSISSIENNLNKNYQLLLANNEKAINNMIDKLILLNPLNVMKKGYTLTYQNDKIITSVNNLDTSKDLIVKWTDGEVISMIKKINKN